MRRFAPVRAGRAIALGLASAGALVGCVDQVPGNVEAAAAEIAAAGSRAVPVAADVTDPAAMSAAVTHIESALGPLTLGVNAAGIAGDLEELLAFYDYPAEHWVHLRTTNPIESTFATVRTARRSPRARARGQPGWRWRSS